MKKESPRERIFSLMRDLRERQIEAEETLDWQLLRMAIAILSECRQFKIKFDKPKTVTWWPKDDGPYEVMIDDIIMVSKHKDLQVLVGINERHRDKCGYVSHEVNDLDFQDLCLSSRCNLVDDMWLRVVKENETKGTKEKSK